MVFAAAAIAACGKSSDKPAPTNGSNAPGSGSASGAGSGSGAGSAAAGSGSATANSGSGSGSVTPSKTTAFVDVTVVAMDSDKEKEHQTVVVDNGTIVSIGDAASTQVPAGAKSIDGKGKWLIPGLIDMHVHFNDERDGILYIANGVTTVRNMWGFPQTLEWRDKAKKNDPSYFGPSIYTAGPIVDGVPPVWPQSVSVHDAKEATAEVDKQKAAGYDFIKVYDNLTLAEYDAIAAEAKKQNIRFAGHMVSAVSLAHAFESGQQSIEHLTGYMQEAQDATSKAATMKNPERRMEMAKHRDPSKIPALAQLTAKAKVANTPTLTVLSRFSMMDEPDKLMARPENKYVTPNTLASWDPKKDFRLKSATPEMFKAMRDGDEFRKQLVKGLLDAGAPILAGTDTPNPFVVPGFSLHEELGRLVEAGLSPFQAMQAATVTGADWIGTKAGRIAKDSPADLVLLDADPLKDITATTKRSGVMVRGAYYTNDELHKKLDDLAESFKKPADKLAKAPPLDVPAGDLEFQGTFTVSLSGVVVAAERGAWVKTKAGGRIILLQSSGDPPAAKLASARIEYDAAGKLVSITTESDGKKMKATVVGDKLHIVGEKTSDVPFPADGLVDANFAHLFTTFLARAKPGAKTTVKAVQIQPDGTAGDETYVIDRTKPGPMNVINELGPQKSDASVDVDDKGFLKKMEAKFAFGTLVIERQ